jgi:hypothetical protein
MIKQPFTGKAKSLASKQVGRMKKTRKFMKMEFFIQVEPTFYCQTTDFKILLHRACYQKCGYWFHKFLVPKTLVNI